MCGIVGYLGDKAAAPILLDGLAKLEYRGYDSAGIAVLENNELVIKKKQGKVAEMAAKVPKNLKSSVGIGHTRWATHGEPSDVNAHPHMAPSGKFALVHNGIIENYASIKEKLAKKGYKFKSDTDTEILACLIDETAKETGLNLAEATRRALQEVVGAYAIVILETAHPDRLIVAKMGSPLVIGVGDNGEFVIASDATPIVGHTRQVVYLEDGKVACCEKGKQPVIFDIATATSGKPVVENLEMQVGEIDKSGFDHFMLKEIYDQPRAMEDTMRGRVLPEQNLVKLGGIADYEARLTRAPRIIIVACGTAWHAGLIGEYFIEQLAGVPVEVEYASEFRYRQPVLTKEDVVIAVSQSGETADTLAAVELAKLHGALTLGICNVVGSSIARATDAGVYTHAGPEISVASTKAFTTQVTVFAELALRLSALRGQTNESRMRSLLNELRAMPDVVAEVLKTDKQAKKIAKELAKARDILFVGRGVSFPVALEGSLKVKEISYIHAEGYPAGELKHGPLALIDKDTPTVAVIPDDEHKEKMISNIEEVKARRGQVWAVTSDTAYAKANPDSSILVPRTDGLLSPLICNIPLQLLAYHVAVMNNKDVDKPRNLAKSVTVE